MCSTSDGPRQARLDALPGHPEALPTSGQIAILYLITELDTGGAQTALQRLLAGLDRARFSPTVACFYNGDSAVAQRIRALGVPVIDLGMTAKWRLDAFVRLYCLLHRQRPTILHTWMFHANLPGRVLGRLAGVPIVISSETTMGQEGWLRCWFNWITSPLPDRVVCVSERVAEFAARTIGIPPAKLVVIPNGVPLEDFQPGDRSRARVELGIPLRAVVAGTVGRLQPVKGTSYLLEAWALLASDHPDAILLLVGGGPQQAALERMSRRLGISERVRFLGDRADVPDLLRGMDVFALPSVWEGMPNAVLEAMAVGLPVVATAVGGTPEVVVDGVTGLLVPSGDSDALAQSIARLLCDPDLRYKMGQAGRERVVNHFSVERTVEQTERLYEQLLVEKGTLGMVH
jgi:sugar transferase (PEP-CTERM/EpsH1 system associated)